jgi:hypothetical protein
VLSIRDTVIENGLTKVYNVTFDFEPEERETMLENMIETAVRMRKIGYYLSSNYIEGLIGINGSIYRL